MTLYELTGRDAELYALLEDTDDEQEIGEILAELAVIENEDIPRKADSIAKIIADCTGKSNMFKEESKRLRARADKYEATAERLKDILLYAMQTTGMVKIPTDIGTWSLRKNPPTVEVTDWTLIPEEYRVKQEDKVLKNEILKAYRNAGDKEAFAEALKGAEITQKESVRLV